MFHWLFTPYFQVQERSSVWAPIYAPSIKQQRLFGFTLTNNRALVVQQTSFSSTPQAKLSTAELFAHLNSVQCSGVKFAS